MKRTLRPNDFLVRNKKNSSIKSGPASEVDGFHDNERITICFARTYKSLFSSVESNKELIVELRSYLL